MATRLSGQQEIRVSKVKGTENPADMGTKHLSLQDIDKCVKLINCYVDEGRSPAVPSIAK